MGHKLQNPLAMPMLSVEVQGDSLETQSNEPATHSCLDCGVVKLRTPQHHLPSTVVTGTPICLAVYMASGINQESLGSYCRYFT